MAKYRKKLDDDIRCPLEYGLTIFGGKWKSRIICVLSAREKLRYSELCKEIRTWKIWQSAYVPCPVSGYVIRIKIPAHYRSEP